MEYGLTRRSWFRLVARVLSLALLWALPLPVLATPSASDEPPPPLADAHQAAASDRAEPSVIVGPAGSTLVAHQSTMPIAPGIQLTTFERFDARGWVRGHVLSVDLAHPDNATDVLFPGTLSTAAPLSTQVARKGAIAGINGDFFDGSNEVPYGVMIENGQLLKSPLDDWTTSIGVGIDRIGRLTDVLLDGSISLPSASLPLAGFNSHIIRPHGIGMFTPVWGARSRSRAVMGATLVREVVVREGKVAAITKAAGSGVPKGTFVLLGRDAGAQALATLKVGDAVGVAYTLRADVPAPFHFAIGGNRVLLRDSQVAALDDTQSEPRTAVGFSADGQTMVLAVVDGRQQDSRGMTLAELADLLKRFGADDALNLDGGGSATIVARPLGEMQPQVINRPSDGQERRVPNGIGLFARPGSGTLTGLRLVSAAGDANTARVFPGLTRTFVAKGYDETYAPVAVRNVAWQILPPHLGVFEQDGVLRAKHPGTAVIHAQAGGVTAASDLHVLGELARIAAEPARLSLSNNAPLTFTVIGYDADGYRAPLEPRDVTLEYDRSIIAITPDADGRLRVTPKVQHGTTLVKVTAAGQQAVLPVTVGLTTVPLSGFESLDGWTFSGFPEAVQGSLASVPGRTGQAVALTYDFHGSTATRAAYVNASPLLAMPGEPQRIGLWVHGDGQGAWLRMVVRDAAKVNHTLNLADEINWRGWRYVEAEVPPGVQYPLQLARIYPVETVAAKQYAGKLIVDDLVVKGAPPIAVPPRVLPPDPLIVQHGTLDAPRWRFAVLNDSQVVATSPDSAQVRATRAALQQIVATQPDFLIINGDFVDRGSAADFELAQQILDEEVGDRFPIYYLPGNHEREGSGNLDHFRARFGTNRFAFDHQGTRFILLDTSTGSLRTADFQQLVDLKQLLQDAATDPAIRHVVVAAHHPLHDPLPTQQSQLSDRKEAELIGQWLSEFQAQSGGKGAVYLSAHAQTVNVERVDGVPHLVLPPTGTTPAGPASNGGFNGWALFGVAPMSTPGHNDWLRAEMRPLFARVALAAPATLASGQTARVTGTGYQEDGRQVPLRYPITVVWSGSDNLLIGANTQAAGAAPADRYAAQFDPATGKLTALQPGEVRLQVTVNGRSAATTIRIQ